MLAFVGLDSELQWLLLPILFFYNLRKMQQFLVTSTELAPQLFWQPMVHAMVYHFWQCLHEIMVVSHFFSDKKVRQDASDCTEDFHGTAGVGELLDNFFSRFPGCATFL
jgi:hypothetical protein